VLSTNCPRIVLFISVGYIYTPQRKLDDRAALPIEVITIRTGLE
jgi:hypothetical protein